MVLGTCETCGPKCVTCGNSTNSCIDCRADLEKVGGICSCPTGKKFNENNECVDLPNDEKLLLKDQNFNKANQIVSIEFEELLQPLNSTQGFSLTLKNSKIKIETKSTSISPDKKFLLFTLDIKDNIENDFLLVTNENIGLIKSKIDSTRFKYFLDYPIEVPISYYFTKMDEAVKANGEKVAIGATILTLGMLLVSVNMALVLIKLFQMLDFFVYLNVDIPVNLKIFISFFD